MGWKEYETVTEQHLEHHPQKWGLVVLGLLAGGWLVHATACLMDKAQQWSAALVLMGVVLVCGFMLLEFIRLWQIGHQTESGLRSKWVGGIMAGLCLLIGISLISRYATPSEKLIGRQDEGLYGLSAINLVQSGHAWVEIPELNSASLQLSDALWEQVPVQALRDGKNEIRSPHHLGWFQDSQNPMHLRSQLPLGYSTFISAPGWWFGLKSILLVNGLLHLLAGLILAVIVSRHLGPWTGLLAWLLHQLFPLHLWMAGTLFAEGLLQVLGLLIVWLWTQREASEHSTTYWAEALIWVFSIFAAWTKLEGLVFPAGTLLLMFWRPSKSTRWTWLWAIPPLVLVWADLRGASGYGGHSLIAVCTAVGSWQMGLTGVGILGLFWYIKYGSSIREIRLRWFGAIAVLLLGLFFMWMWPEIMKGHEYYYWPHKRVMLSYRGETFPRLIWYLGAGGLLLSLLGLAAGLIYIKNRALTVWVMIGIGTLFLLSYNVMNNPVQPYCMRRFIGITSPVLIMSLVLWISVARLAGIRWCRSSILPHIYGPMLLGISLLVLIGVQWWKLNEKMNRDTSFVGFLDQLETIPTMADNSLILVYGHSPLSGLADPLIVIRGCRFMALYQPLPELIQQAAFRQFLQSLENQQRPLYLLSESWMPRMPGITFSGQPILGQIRVTEPKQSYEMPPGGTTGRSWNYRFQQFHFQNSTYNPSRPGITPVLPSLP